MLLPPFQPFLDSRPELRELHILSRDDKTVRIRDGAASKWKDLAIQLNFQPGTINIIQSDSYYRSEDAFDMVMSRWLNGGGRHPVTWKTLIRALEDIDLNVLAQDVQQTLEVSYIATDTEDHHDSTHCCTLL